MSSRTYLSIGDVLTLLREEFPDVTISKIRFLESQGLVNPERSPSGYRKFFDHDVERLRWVLRQQREHFLPLKVIRDRLEDGDLDGGGLEAVNGGPGSAAAIGEASGVARGSAAGAVATHVAEQPTKADEEAMARILADASRRAAQIPSEAPARRGLQVVGEGTATATAEADPAEVPDVAPEAQAVHAGAVSARAGSPRRTGSTGGGNGTPSGGTRGRSKNAPADATGPTPAPPARRASGGGGARGASADGTTGASLTLDELCTATGLAPEEVKGLQSFGLVESTNVAGIETFDQEALTVANLAVSFRSYGVEPRHLRLYRNAVDREVGLIEQVIIPLLRLRNPESRQRAVDSADELASLGQSMRTTLLRAALRRHLGG